VHKGKRIQGDQKKKLKIKRLEKGGGFHMNVRSCRRWNALD